MHCAELSILLHRALESRVGTLMNNLSVVQWQEQPEALHEIRVASRRVRAVLDLVDPELYPGYRRQGRKLKSLTRALGRSREMDVHIGILEDLAKQTPGLAAPAMEHALEAIERHRRKAKDAMARDLARLSLKHLPHLLVVPSMPDPFRAGDLAAAVWGCLEPSLDHAFAPAELLDQEDPRALHLLRIRIKRLRYALEVLAGAFPQPPETQLSLLKRLQTALGEHHDRATLQAQLEQLQRGLEARQRPVLAGGTRGILAQLDEERLIAFEQFRALAIGTSREQFAAGLRRDLGLGPEEGPAQP